MKSKLLIISALLVSLLASGCNKQKRPQFNQCITLLDNFEGVREEPANVYVYRFALPTTALNNDRYLHMQFQDDLRGAKVDVTGFGPHGQVPVFQERRFGDNQITAELPRVQLSSVEVAVHLHFRRISILREACLGVVSSGQRSI